MHSSKKNIPHMVGNTTNYVFIYIYTWNPNDLRFGWKRAGFGGGLTFKNRGQKGAPNGDESDAAKNP